ncbi:glycosyltransferase 87 family protein [Streptomyces sp. Qhu-G9]|uniref:glycosyltransferase 87 family protein n=1 Tax=Streptomyces sp. Qhu-G9 TaxID=3452799 RepID=UPI0022AC59FC|nr:glycosyltransferase 87 family protein [Streptomyces aurantiacus]WAU80137.1 glycosyltransferase 87 family protein [Streptomyces aurantiacus]
MAGARGTRFPYVLLVTWGLTRLALLLLVFKVIVFPGPDVTSDVTVTYQGWYEVLRTGTFPLDDVTWQYPPAAALAILSPSLLPFLAYTEAFFVLAFAADLVALGLLLYAARSPGRSRRGAWVWVVGVPLLGPTVYSRYDVMVTAVVVAAILAGVRNPKLMGALAAFGALLKVWPLLLLVGTTGRRAWAWAAGTAAGIALLFTVSMPGAFAFLTFQRDRGTEVESLGSLVFHIARHHGWEGQVLLNYGSVEFLGPYVDVVSTVALMLTGLAFGWLLLWRLCATRFLVHTVADAAFVAVLLFTTTSRVISPQYMVWLVGLAAVCLVFRGSRMGLPAGMVVVASFVTVLEFPVYFADVVASNSLGITLLVIRNGLLVAATVTAGTLLWRDTVSYADAAPAAGRPAPVGKESLTP